MNSTSDPVQAELVETLSLVEICNVCRVAPDWITDLVEHGLLDPQGTNRDTWSFAGHSLGIVARAHRLEHDLGLNVEGVALALSLVDQAQVLRRRIEHLEAALAERA